MSGYSFFLLLSAAVAAATPSYAQQAQRGAVALHYTDALPSSAPVQFYKSSKALVIGIDRYTSWRKLGNAVKDAEAVAAVLKAQGFDVALKKDLKAAELTAVLRDFFNDADPDTRLFVWFAGHGHTVKTAGGTEEGFLVPADAPPSTDRSFRSRAYALSDLGSRMTLTDARHVLAVFDSCFSGAALAITRQEALAGPVALSEQTRGLARQMITSGDRDQPVLDNGDFAREFLAVIRGEVAGVGRNGTVTAKEIGVHLERRMPELTKRGGVPQRPQFGYLNRSGFDRGNFVFVTGVPAAPVQPPVVVAAAAPSRGNVIEIVAHEWARLATSKDRASLEAFRRQFGGDNPFYDQQAATRLAALDDVKRPPTPPAPPLGPVTPQPVAPTKPSTAAAPTPGTVFRDCPTCPEMVVVPAGNFMMGSPANEKERESNEGPQRRVTIAHPVAVGKFEVTFAEWDACIAGGGCTHKPDDKQWGRGKRPVIYVSWDDAKQYVSWLAKTTGQPYRLLTEAEWEYAARAGTTTPFSFGPTLSTDQANYDGNFTYAAGKKGIYRQKTIEVGSLNEPNAFGLHDMHGNVAEWVEDCYKVNYNGGPFDGSKVADIRGCLRVDRGGSWFYSPGSLRAASRGRFTSDYRIDYVGFRVARPIVSPRTL